MGKGQDLYKRAKEVIPGGTMLLSKRPEMFLPDNWPSYYSKSKGCKVWDLDGKELIDVSIMGIGTNILGYGHPEVDEAVLNIVRSGNMSSLNCPEEVELAERLVEMHPWADMVRFARTGGEANAMSIRIARAASGKDKVAICGYHGWHDWYLSANLGNEKSLEGHLLPGLDPAGVPKNLEGSVLPFNYNDFESLKSLVSKNDIGVIKMEVRRNHDPEDNFLHKVRELATAEGIVLIFDECTSGFRQSFGGLHKIYGVDPDVAIFSKALGNGYAISAVIGKRSVMESAQKTFISSTFWTERIGPTAALKALEVMGREKTWDTITNMGEYVLSQWKKIAQSNRVGISTSGLPSLATFSFNSKNHLAYKTFITQEMLKKGYLASTNLYVSIAHSKEIIDDYLTELNKLFLQISSFENEGQDVMKFLDGPVCHSGFKRLN
jgi:glutamate-1-semialdehyde 2,1-aminomutase